MSDGVSEWINCSEPEEMINMGFTAFVVEEVMEKGRDEGDCL